MIERTITERGPSVVGRVYGFGLLLVLGLFFFHLTVLFDVAGFLVSAQSSFEEYLGPRSAGIAIVMGCFVVLFIAHGAEAAAWALFLRWHRVLSSFSEGLYFSAATISALGYGDVVLARPWRQLGPMVAIAGVLKFGCSTAFLFVVMQQVWVQHL